LGCKFLLSRWINLLGVIGVTVGVWALIVVIAIFSGFIREVRAHIRGAASDLSYLGQLGMSYRKLEKILLTDPNVVACAPRLVSHGMVFYNDTPEGSVAEAQLADQESLLNNFVQVLGIDPDREREICDFTKWLQTPDLEQRVENPEQPFETSLERIERAHNPGINSTPPAAMIDAPGILLSSDRVDVYRFRSGRHVRPGASIMLVTIQPNAIFGLSQAKDHRGLIVERNFTLSGCYQTVYSQFDKSNVLVPIDVLRSIMGFDQDQDGAIDVFNEISIKLRDYDDAQATMKRLGATLAKEDRFWDQRQLRTWEDRNRQFLSAVDNERGLMTLVLFVIVMVAGFLIFATMSMMVTEKTRDIGILNAMGATRTGILSIFMICGSFIGLAGCVLGVVTGYFSTIHLNDFDNWLYRHFEKRIFNPEIYKLREIPYELDPWWILQVVAIAFSMSTLFSLIPAWRAARFDPIKALRYE
jgi:lipoprotein-releasing system permease protein